MEADVWVWTLTAGSGYAVDPSNGVAEWTVYAGAAKLITFTSATSSFGYAERDSVANADNFVDTLQWIHHYVDDWTYGSECHQDYKTGITIGWVSFLGVVLPTGNCGSSITGNCPCFAVLDGSVDLDCFVNAHWTVDLAGAILSGALMQKGYTSEAAKLNALSAVTLEGHTTKGMTSICALDIAHADASSVTVNAVAPPRPEIATLA